MKKSILVKNLSAVISVTRLSENQSYWREKNERVLTGDKPLSCSQCAAEFAWFWRLLNKSALMKNPLCSYKRCDYKSKQSTALMTHERIPHVRTNTGYKPLSCKQCYYECKQLTALTYERIHTNEKRFIQDARIAFTNMLGHSQEPTIYYSSKELCSTKISPVDRWRIL